MINLACALADMQRSNVSPIHYVSITCIIGRNVEVNILFKFHGKLNCKIIYIRIFLKDELVTKLISDRQFAKLLCSRYAELNDLQNYQE